MSVEKIIRAWKDVAYRESLGTAERALLPEHPAGLIELSDVELAGVAGGPLDVSYGECSTEVKNLNCMLTINYPYPNCSVGGCI